MTGFGAAEGAVLGGGPVGRAGGGAGARDAGEGGAGTRRGARRATRRAGGAGAGGGAAGARAAQRGTRAAEKSRGRPRRRRTGGSAAAGRRDRAAGGPRGHHGGAGATAYAPGRVSRRAGAGRRDRQAARLPGAGARARGEYDRRQGVRRRDHAGGDRHEGRTREVPRAARESGVTPRVIVLSAPSGGGKTSIAQALLGRRTDVGYSVSATTRRPRSGEHDGAAYHFLDRAEFERRRRAGAFLEHAEYAGERYGTLKEEVARLLRKRRHVLMDIDVQGVRQVRRADPPPPAPRRVILPPPPAGRIAPRRRRPTPSPAQLPPPPPLSDRST